MAYERLNLNNGITFDASHVQHLEEGIEGAFTAAGDAATAATTATEKANEAVAAVAAASSPVKYVESLDEENIVNLRDLETGSYVLHGYFRPFADAPNMLTIESQTVNVVTEEAGSHVLIFSAMNSVVNFLEIMVDEEEESGFKYTRTDISMLDLHGLISKVGNLEELVTEEKGSIVAAINEIAAKVNAEPAE